MGPKPGVKTLKTQNFNGDMGDDRIEQSPGIQFPQQLRATEKVSEKMPNNQQGVF